MKKTHTLTLAIIGLLAFMSPAPQAAEGVTNAGVTLDAVPAVTVFGGGTLQFGVLSIPTDVAATWVLDVELGGLTKTSSNSIDRFLNDHFRGTFQITGQEGFLANYTVSVLTDFTDPAVTLSNLTVSPMSPQPLPQIPIALFVVVGGTLTIGTTATAGIFSEAMIQMTANY